MPSIQAVLDRKQLRDAQALRMITPYATALEAAQRMNEYRIGSLLVMEGDQLVGIVTERDILRRVVASQRDPSSTHVSEIMTEQVAVCHRHTTLAECKAVMTDLRIRRLPVMDEGRLVGLISIGDLTAFEIESHQHTIEYLNAYLEMPPVPHG